MNITLYEIPISKWLAFPGTLLFWGFGLISFPVAILFLLLIADIKLTPRK